ncbi:MAG: DUF2953 domain-containing protein [Hespellia sp.]|nr:DUF2953 domain-containing protein [Hespellia sp.]
MMLHVLLLILKIIGILILVILGLFVLLLAIVLLVPLRYKVTGSGAGDLKSLQGKVTFSWLLHLVSGYAGYQDQKLDWNVRIAWKWLGGEEETAPEPEPELALETKSEPESEPAVDPEPVMKPEPVTEPEPAMDPEPAVTAQESEPSVRKEQPKKASIVSKVKAFFEKIKYTFRKIYDNIKALMETKDRLEEFVTDEVHQAALSRAIKELKRLLGFLKPKKFSLQAHLGFKDPSVTGKVLAGLSMIYPFAGKNQLCVQPEFEEEIYEGNLMIRGHVRVVYVIIIAWNLFWDKNIRMTYKHIKNFKK